MSYVLGQYGMRRWTPYATAIAKCYRSVVPFFMNIDTTLTDQTYERKTVAVPAHQYDRLFFAAHVKACVTSEVEGEDVITEDSEDVETEDDVQVITEAGGDMAANCGGQQVFLQVADDALGQKWATLSPIDAAPLSAFGGSSEHVMPLIRLPEAFFLPKGVDLRFDFKTFNNSIDGGMLTWVGVRLADGETPSFVDVPKLGKVKVGSRIPWFAVIGMGREQQIADNAIFLFNSGRRCLGYTQPAECDVEIHDIHGQFSMQVEDLGGDPDLIQFALSDTGQRKLWTKSFTPSRAFLGDTTKAFPVMPLPVPYLLKAGRQLELTMLNNSSGVGVSDGFVVIRGVMRCGLL